jgi:hypothetical protein
MFEGVMICFFEFNLQDIIELYTPIWATESPGHELRLLIYAQSFRKHDNLLQTRTNPWLSAQGSPPCGEEVAQ